MSSILFVCRHGNTFASGERVVMVGAKQDLPLTLTGEEQASAVGRAIKSCGVSINRVVAGPLIRTREFARLIISSSGCNLQIEIDERLKELDYGAWGGLSDQEIAQLSGSEVLRDWQQYGMRPAGVDFSPSVEIIERELREVLDEFATSTCSSVLITSNGRLRELGRIVGGLSAASAKVSTGGICVLQWDDGAWRVLVWNSRPEDLLESLKGTCKVDKIVK